MSKIKVLIVEDEIFIAQSMRLMLEELDYEVIGIGSDAAETRDILSIDTPDIALLDLKLRNDDDGIELAKDIRKKHDFPIIFSTSLSDKETVERAKEVHPQGYLVKPFEKNDLYTSIEIALSNFLQSDTQKLVKEEENYFFKEYLFVKRKHQFEKVRIHDIEWIKSEGNYLEMICQHDKKYLIRSTFHEFFQHVDSDIFLQVHKSYAVNFDHIDSVRPTEIVVNKKLIPIGKTYHDVVRKRLNIVF